jgi:uncharacterized protein YjbI with pentapeptide repeats
MAQTRPSTLLITWLILITGTLIFVIFRQNRIIEKQAAYQLSQEKAQAEMMETIRKTGHADMLANMLNQIDTDLRDDPDRKLSDETISRIAALCYAFQPTGNTTDSATAIKLSPERGQLLLMLTRMNIDSASFRKVLLLSTFSGAVLKDADLREIDLSGAALNGADFRNAKLEGSNFSKADLRAANFHGAQLQEAVFVESDLKRANMSWADINDADLRKADLNGADLTSAQLRRTDLREALIQWATLNNAFLDSADMTKADLRGSVMTRTHLKGANLIGANLREAFLTETNLTGTILDKATVEEENWITLLEEKLVKGSEEIREQYKVVKAPSAFRLERLEVASRN